MKSLLSIAMSFESKKLQVFFKGVAVGMVLLLLCCSEPAANQESLPNNDLQGDSTFLKIKKLAALMEKHPEHLVRFLTDDRITNEMLEKKIEHWSQNYLAEMRLWSTINEPVLHAGIPEETETYRFFWTHAFLSHAVSIRILEENGRYSLITKVVEVDPEADNLQEVVLRVDSLTQLISEEEWLEFERLVSDSYFWDINDDNQCYGFDGSHWTLEGASNKSCELCCLPSYHSVYRWTPRKSSSFAEACLYLVEISKLDFMNVPNFP